MSISPYLNFNGNTREVVLFYAQVFGLEEPVFNTFGSMPMNPEHPLPPDAKDLIVHAQLTIGGSRLMFSDVFPGMPYQQGIHNFSLAFVSKDGKAVRDAFHKLKEGGTITMELQATPWSPLFGMVTDKYGISWQFNLEG